jgi:hypothetical protein
VRFRIVVSIHCILGLQSIPWDLHDEDSAAMLEENKPKISDLIISGTLPP